MTIKYEAEKILFACRITKARLQTHTLAIFNKYCFSAAITNTQMHLNTGLFEMIVGVLTTCHAIYT
jgi:hypothetical protein